MDLANETFDATYIYNFSGRAKRIASKMSAIGIKNCKISNPSMPNGCPNHLRAHYYIKDIIRDMKENKYEKVNIIADVLLSHNKIGDLFGYLIPSLTQNWDIIQYSSADHRYRNLNLPFNWEFYLKLHDDINTDFDESSAKCHWDTVGMNSGRIPGFIITSTESNNTLAFAISSNIVSKIEQRMEHILGMDVEKSKKIGILDIKCSKIMTVPNLFILPNTGNAVCKSLKWYKPNYSN